MAVYVGLEAIAKRMGWKSRKTPVARLMREGFPIYQERRIGKAHGIGCPVWRTNDSLIMAWEWAKVTLERDRLLRREAEKRQATESRGSAPGPQA